MKHSNIQFKIIEVDSCISAVAGATNCIVVWKKNLAVVVDPGGEGEKIVRFLKRNKLTVGEYWLTHAHPDHVGGLSVLLEEFPAPVRYHHADSLLMKVSFPFRSTFGDEFQPFGNVRGISCGNIAARVMRTPGHSPGGVCYWFEKEGVLLSGDTLMCGYVGATIYPGGVSADLDASVRKLFRTVPDGAMVIAGHGEKTTIGAERTRGQPDDSVESRWDNLKASVNKFRKGVYVTQEELDTAFNKVRNELTKMGLLRKGTSLDEVGCIPEWRSGEALAGLLGKAMAYYHDPKIVDNEDGHIHFPTFYPGFHVGERPLLDTLRHEFGHAIAHRYADFFRCGAFKAAFGVSYYANAAEKPCPPSGEYVSDYAMEDRREDYAETFMFYMKYKGRFPARFRGQIQIEKKWKAIAEIVKGVAKEVAREARRKPVKCKKPLRLVPMGKMPWRGECRPRVMIKKPK